MKYKLPRKVMLTAVGTITWRWTPYCARITPRLYALPNKETK